jgi:flagellar biosynthesis/type III secretory pathway protein FliH
MNLLLYKYKAGNKVIYKEQEYTVGALDSEPDTYVIYNEVSEIHGVNGEELKSIKDMFKREIDEEEIDNHLTTDDIAELFAEAEEKDKKEHTLPNPADLMDEDMQRIIDKVEKENESREHEAKLIHERTKGYYAGAEDAMKDIQRIKKEEYKKGYTEGFFAGQNSVITNLENFLKGIKS